MRGRYLWEAHLRRVQCLGWQGPDGSAAPLRRDSFATGERPDGPLPCTFVTDGIESAVEQARGAAAGQDVVLMGASMVQQCLRAGLLDEIIINLVPALLGDGVKLFEAGSPGDYQLAIDNVITAPRVTHLTYRVVR